jgi:hypothetical protein
VHSCSRVAAGLLTDSARCCAARRRARERVRAGRGQPRILGDRQAHQLRKRIHLPKLVAGDLCIGLHSSALQSDQLYRSRG